MPIPADVFAEKMPTSYRAFLDSLWDGLEVELRGTFACPIPLRDDFLDIDAEFEVEADTKYPVGTTLARWRDILGDIAATDAVATVAKKAYQTDEGRRAIEWLTRATLTIPERIGTFPADLEKVQRAYLLRLLDTIMSLKEMINQDHPNTSDDGFWHSNALHGVLGEEVSLRGLFQLDQSLNLKGKLRPYGLERLLESMEQPIRSRIDNLLDCAETTDRGDATVRRTAFALWDALEDQAEDFGSGKTGPLKRAALVTAFVVALFAKYPSTSEALIRVNEMLSKRPHRYAKDAARKARPA